MMVYRNILWPVFLSILPWIVSLSFAGEIFRWTDDKGTVHFTDDASKIPPHYPGQIDRRDSPEVTPSQPDKGTPSIQGEDRVTEYLKAVDRKIATKKKLERKASDLEEELDEHEKRLKAIVDYEREYYYYFIPYRDPKTGRFVPLGSPYYDEKVRLESRVEVIRKELRSLREAIEQIQRSL